MMLPTADGEANRLIETASIQYREALDRRHIRKQASDQIGQEPGVPATLVCSRLRLAVNWLKCAPRRAHMKGATT